jgi:hypothetical protein
MCEWQYDDAPSDGPCLVPNRIEKIFVTCRWDPSGIHIDQCAVGKTGLEA